MPLRTALWSLACTVAVVARQQVSINAGWRFHLGNFVPPPAACPGGAAHGFSTNLTGQKCLYGWCGACDGLLPFEEGFASPEACRDACCADSLCGAWNWRQEADGRNCWTGSTCLNPTSAESYVGGQRRLQPSNHTAGVPHAAELGLNDSSWEIVDTPHDFVSYGEYTQIGAEIDNSQANLPKNVSWYRKHFRLPPSWKGRHLELYVEGAYSVATYYLNGALLGTHTNGYTSAIWRLDDTNGHPATSLNFDGETDNVLAVFVDARMAQCSGWWYEGGGIFRNSYLISSSHTRIPSHGISVGAILPSGNRSYNYPALPRDGITASSASVEARVAVESDVTFINERGTRGSAVVADVEFKVVDKAGDVVASHTVSAVELPTNISASLPLVGDIHVWSVARPYLYTLAVTVTTREGTEQAAVADSVNTSFGVRSVEWSASEGLLLNGQRVKMRGFCNHESFAGVGSAIPERINLFRLQQMRGVGGNSWRASSNPPSPGLLSLADRLGVLIMDENRVFKMGISNNMEDLVARDQNHPSVIWFNLCNEGGCNDVDRSAPTQPTLSFKQAVAAVDVSAAPARAITANMCLHWGSCPKEDQFLNKHFNLSFEMPALLDVQGFSHVHQDMFTAYHQAWPLRPLAATECCSCLSQRGEDDDLTPPVSPKAPGNATVFYSSLNVDCVREQTQYSDSLKFVAGTFVWTLHDYLGEPGGWPLVSSSFGSFDVAGFPKAAVWWYRSWWLANISVTDPGRPGLNIPTSTSTKLLPSAIEGQTSLLSERAARHGVAEIGTNSNGPADQTAIFLHIVETPTPHIAARVVHVYTNAPFVRLLDQVQAVPRLGYATFNVSASADSKARLEWTATALGADSTTVLATHVASHSGDPASLRLSLDAPTPRTGTGSALYLDGVDVALMRAEVLDKDGIVVHGSDNSIMFTVVSGPGMLHSTANGNPADHTPIHSHWRKAYHGLARAVIRAAVDASGSEDERVVRRLVNPDAGRGDVSAAVTLDRLVESVVVEACTAGLPCTRISIRTSVDERDSPLEVATRNVALADIS